MKPQTLLGLDKGDRELALALEQLQKGELELPPGCDITYELEAIDILRAWVFRGIVNADSIRR